MGMNEPFRKFSGRMAAIVGSANAFLLALSVVVVWIITGPIFDFSNTWQLFINTGTTIVTFLMVFIIQNTQNRDTKSIRLQLDELISTAKGASDLYLDLDEMSDDELERLRQQFKQAHERVERHHKARKQQQQKS
ncbi:low affinity iron permease family protein [Candidatus Saccharibacteria bacterium]|nr:MAG: low affinity iron permease family protein [Candidatus Saccharibacteria bacterium]